MALLDVLGRFALVNTRTVVVYVHGLRPGDDAEQRIRGVPHRVVVVVAGIDGLLPGATRSSPGG